jgi:hypothetical protein
MAKRRSAKTSKVIEINPDLNAAYTWNVYGGGRLMYTVNADNVLVTGDGALNFVANIGGTTVSVFVVPVPYNYAQKV